MKVFEVTCLEGHVSKRSKGISLMKCEDDKDMDDLEEPILWKRVGRGGACTLSDGRENKPCNKVYLIIRRTKLGPI